MKILEKIVDLVREYPPLGFAILSTIATIVYIIAR